MQDFQNGLDINATRMDSDTNDITANGLGLCMTRDGQGAATASIPFIAGATFGPGAITTINASGDLNVGGAFTFSQGTLGSAAFASAASSLTLVAGVFTSPSITDFHVVTFSGTTGAIADSGINAANLPLKSNNGSDYTAATFAANIGVSQSNTTGHKSVTESGSLVSGNFPEWTGTAGDTVDSGVAVSNLPLISNNGSDFNASTFKTNLGIGVSPVQGIFFKDTGTVTTVSSFGGVTINRTGTGAYDFTLGSAALVMGFCQAYGQDVGTGDGWNLTASSNSTMAANGTYSFVGRNASSKTASNASVCLVLFY